MTLIEYPGVEQRSDEWMDLRRGILTASAIGSLISIGAPGAESVACPACRTKVNEPCVSLVATKKRTPIKTAHDARTSLAAGQPPVYAVADNDTSRAVTATLVAERIAGWTEETPMSSDMWRGVESEPFAREAYNGSRDHEAVEYGFMIRQEPAWRLGLSPDGVVGDDGLIEIKCPRAKTHVQTILADEVPAHYMPQCQAALFISGRKWLDFCSYVGGLPLYVKRVFPEPQWFAAIEQTVTRFEQNASVMEANYRDKSANLPATERPAYLMEIV